MTPFGFSLPGRVIFGRGEAGRAPGLIGALGDRGVLVHGADASRAAWLVDGLRAQGAAVLAVSCGAEPSLPMLRDALHRARSQGADWACGLGGGSALDMAKALAALIPATLLGLWAGFARSPWRVLSVAGRMRWGWLGRCLLVVTPLWAAYLGVTWVVFDQEVLERPRDWAWLLVITVLTTPLQAAGEEIAIRGGLVQGVGASRWSGRTSASMTRV